MQRSPKPRLLVSIVLVLAGCARGHACGEGNVADVDAAVSISSARAPDVVRRDGNGLVGSASEYLREHDHDPVDWQPWSDVTLARARRENKPIFLSIGYSACHFCHVMHDEVFAKDDVAAILNARFVAIKVDREERPDLDATYIAALEQLAGSAGWPASLFLEPTLAPFFGATYVPHDRFLELAKGAADAYEKRDAGALHTVDLHDLLGDGAPTKGTGLEADEIRAIATETAARFDPVRGGTKSGTKFPMAPRLRFLLHAARKWILPDVTAALRTTLDAMAAGALRDPISGAFHRYTTDPDWTTPHYEVMLYDQAQLALLYLEAGAVFASADYMQIARETLDFMASDMVLPNHAFAASFDADTHGEEGAAWRWSRADVEKVADKDAPVVVALLGLDEAARAPTRRLSIAEVAARLHLPAADVASAWERARPKLRTWRAGVAQRDDKIVAAWNGLAIEAFSAGFAATGLERYRDIAAAAALRIDEGNRNELGVLLRSPGGVPAFGADLGDLANGDLAVFSATSDSRYLAKADALLAEAKTLEAEGGGFYDGSAPLARSVATDDGVEPTATAALLRAFDRRSALAADPSIAAPVTRALGKYGNLLREQKAGAAGWLDAALFDAGPVYELVITGTDAAAQSLVAAAGALAAPWSIGTRLSPELTNAELLAAVPGLEGKAGPVARAFVCEKMQCKAPTSDPKILRQELLQGWER